ncbi:3-dehydrosphinganine reductase TSC10A-like protein [Tanacetum coccineum]
MADINLSYLTLITLIPITLLIFLKLITRPRATSIPIKSRHVFITGGSSGIGLALAKHSASEGARVTILARDLHKLQEAKTSIRLSTGIDVGVISADVTDYEAVKEAVESVGPIDVLICNQGVFVAQEIEKQEIKEVKEMIDVNLVGTFNLVKAALPGMKNRTDRKPVSIAFMSSQAGQFFGGKVRAGAFNMPPWGNWMYPVKVILDVFREAYLGIVELTGGNVMGIVIHSIARATYQFICVVGKRFVAVLEVEILGDANYINI